MGRGDPVLGFNFLVTLLDTGSDLAAVASAVGAAVLGGFSECSGLDGTLQVEEYKEGGRNDAVLKFPTRAQWGNITLKRGVTALPGAGGLWDWYHGFVRGRGRRRDGLIVLQDEARAPVAVWQFRRGLPVKWTGPSLNAAQNAVAVEALEIAHEGLTWVTAAAAVGG
ncbi:MAG TPA: phage tail protein [Urbifossiella sp.]|nr:phage tail protein [Urbifossiella sp.]